MTSLPDPWVLIGLLINILTLAILGVYTKAAIHTAEAASAQAEAVLMPVVVVVAAQDRADDSVVESLEPDGGGARPVLPNHTITLENIGGGPALSLSYRITNPANTKRPISGRQNFVMDRGAPGRLDTQYKVGWLLDGADIHVEYKSASGIRYFTAATFKMQTTTGLATRAFLASQKFGSLRRKYEGREAGLSNREPKTV